MYTFWIEKKSLSCQYASFFFYFTFCHFNFPCLNFAKKTCSSAVETVEYLDVFIPILVARTHQTSNNLSFYFTVLSLSCTCAVVKTLLESWVSTDMGDKSAFSSQNNNKKNLEKTGDQASKWGKGVKERETGGKAEEATTMGERWGRERERAIVRKPGRRSREWGDYSCFKRERKKSPRLPMSGELELIKWFHYCPPLLLR